MRYSTYIQNTVEYFIPDRAGDHRLMSVYVIVEEVSEECYFSEDGHPKFKILQALGFEHIEGVVFWPPSTELRKMS